MSAARTINIYSVYFISDRVIIVIFILHFFSSADYDDGQYHARYQNEQYDIRNNIPGEPELDYPIYSAPPVTSFTCQNRHDGMCTQYENESYLPMLAVYLIRPINWVLKMGVKS